MNESTAYKWAAQAMKPIKGLLEPHKGQQLADKIVAAILEAYKKGRTEIDLDKSDIKAAEKLCKIYFDIAARFAGEDEVRRMMNVEVEDEILRRNRSS